MHVKPRRSADSNLSLQCSLLLDIRIQWQKLPHQHEVARPSASAWSPCRWPRRGVTDERVLEAMRQVPREAFVGAGMEEFAYEDSPLPIAAGQTISQPYIVALMIEAAQIKPSDRVLDVGTGSGYAAAVLSRLAAKVSASSGIAIWRRARGGRWRG